MGTGTAQVTLQIPEASPYDGNPRVATAVTDPEGLSVLITYDGSETPPSNAGTYTVVGTVTSPSYTGNSGGMLTILRAAQTIIFTSTPPAPGLVGATYQVSAAGGASGNPVVFSSLTPDVCSVTGSTVSLNAAGTCTMAADQAGTINYVAAPQVTQQRCHVPPARRRHPLPPQPACRAGLPGGTGCERRWAIGRRPKLSAPAG